MHCYENVLPYYVFLISIVALLSGCANNGNRYSGGDSNSPDRLIDFAFQETGNCLQVKAVGSKAQCANQLYSRINNGIVDSDPDKAPVLRAVTRMFSLCQNLIAGK